MKKNDALYVITPGDPGGIGAEVTLKALSKLRKGPPFLVIGAREPFEKLKKKLPLKLNEIRSVQEINEKKPPKSPWLLAAPPGHAGMQAGWSVETAARLILDGRARALITGPIHKERLNAGGYRYNGHTDFLATLASSHLKSVSGDASFEMLKPVSPGTPGVGPAGAPGGVTMMLYNSKLRVSLVTTHCSLDSVSRKITRASLCLAANNTISALKDWFKIKKPTVAFCSLNPHAGEGGLLGNEDDQIVRPTVAQLQEEWSGRATVLGPFPSDSLFTNVVSKKLNCDAVIAMYHDQGLIPVKLLDFSNTINITLGLPFVRTSVDHGVAFDIAGLNKADSTSMLMAIREAIRLTVHEKRGLLS